MKGTEGGRTEQLQCRQGHQGGRRGGCVLIPTCFLHESGYTTIAQHSSRQHNEFNSADLISKSSKFEGRGQKMHTQSSNEAKAHGLMPEMVLHSVAYM